MFRGCVNTIESVLGCTDGISEVHVDLDSQKATILGTLTIQQLIEALDEIGTREFVHFLIAFFFSTSLDCFWLLFHPLKSNFFSFCPTFSASTHQRTHPLFNFFTISSLLFSPLSTPFLAHYLSIFFFSL